MSPKKWLDIRRAETQTTAGEFAALIGVSRMTVHRWEKGQAKMTLDQAVTLAKLANVNVNEVATVFVVR